ncbi:MAG TPA: helix-turn-helix transcriptional regulator [Solirubrobacterales bacterium]|nr:helix-turn-helix transcriptional regulator [Solirubrobacterales bacterium]
MSGTAKPPELFFAIAVRLYRLQLEMSQEELALKIEMKPSELSRIESGRRNPTLRMMTRVAKGLGVPSSRLLLVAERLEAVIDVP